MKIYDQHVHSYYSFDSKERIEEYLNKVSSLGIKYFVLTDHCDLNYVDTHKDIFFDVEKQHQELERLQSIYPKIRILHGIEVGYKPSEINRINDIIHNHHFDLINLSLHESDGVDYYHIKDFDKFGIDKTLEIYFLRQLEAVENFDDYDVLCHVDYAFKTAYLNDNSLSIKKYEDILVKILKTLIKKNKALEINVKVQEVLPIEYTKYLLTLYKDLGGKYLTISSDAHFVTKYYEGFHKYIELIKETGFECLTYFINREIHLLKI